MGGHHRFGGRHRGGFGGHGRVGFFRQAPDLAPDVRPIGKAKPILWAIVIIGAVLWTLFAWIAYGLVDSLLGWTSANAGPLASTAGAGGIGGLLGQLSGLVQSVAKPAVVIVWAIGILVLLAAPAILSRASRLVGRFRH